MRLERTPDKREVGSSTLPRPTRAVFEGSRAAGEARSAIPENGGVAQLGERLPCTQEVIGSIPFTSTVLERPAWEWRVPDVGRQAMRGLWGLAPNTWDSGEGGLPRGVL